MNKRQTPRTTQHDTLNATPAADLGELWQTLDVLPEAETPNTAGEGQPAAVEPVKIDGEQFNRLPSEVEVPIIPLPLPFVRPETDSDPDGNVKG